MALYKKLDINADLAQEIRSNQSSLVALKGDINAHQLEITFLNSSSEVKPDLTGWQLSVRYIGADEFDIEDMFTMSDARTIIVDVNPSVFDYVNTYSIQLTLTNTVDTQVITCPKLFEISTKNKIGKDTDLAGVGLLDAHVEEINKPELDSYTAIKDAELDTHVEEINKPELDSYTITKEGELDSYELAKEGELDYYTATKESELDTYTLGKETQLNNHVESLENTTDVVLKGIGFGSKLGVVTGTDLEDEIDVNRKLIYNCSQALDSRLIAGMDFRGDQPKFYGILPEMSNQLGYGDGTTFSDENGTDGVLVKKDGEEDGFMRIGEAYENIIKRNSVISYGELYNHKFLIPKGLYFWSGGAIFPNVNVVAGDIVQISIDNLKHVYDIDSRGFNVEIDGVAQTKVQFQDFIDGKAKITMTATGVMTKILLTSGRYGGLSGENLSVAINDTPVPFVSNISPSGRLVYNEPWTSATHTIISLDETEAEQEFFENTSTLDLHLKSDGTTKNEYIKSAFIYEGILSSLEKDDELAKIKSTGFQLPDTGVIENIPYSKKKSDAHGSLKTYTEVDDTRDIGLLEEESMWEIIKLLDNTVSHASVSYVVDTWTIVGALDNVSGMLRVQYPAKIRRI